MTEALIDSSQTGSGPAADSTIFVSYSRDDQKRALPIIALIEAAGYRVWWDGLLDPGERFSNTTEAALERAKAVVVLWSKTSTGSHWVHDEATRGRDRRVLVPLSLDGSEAPLGFRQFQVIDFSKAKLRNEAPQVQALLRTLAALHDRPHVEAVRSAGPQVSRRALIGGGAALAATAGGLAAWRFGLLGGGAAATSIAVLPFTNLSGDPEQAYFSDGLAAEIRAQLTRNELLQVAAQTSSNVFRERTADAQTIARKLRVAYFLDGTVRRAGDAIKISVELVAGKTGVTEWEESFERPLVNIFAMQDEIAAKVASALSLEIDPAHRLKAGGKTLGGTASVAAYDAYLRGRDLYDFGANEATDREALAKFDEAIRIDPGYAAAHAARSRALAVIANLHASPAERIQLYRKSVAAGRRAVELAPELAEAHSALGFAVMVGELDMKGAQESYQRSLALGQGDADVLSRYAIFRSRFGDTAAAQTAIQQSSALDPLNPRTFRSVGDIALAAGQLDAAIAGYQRALALNPKLYGARAAIGFIQLIQGKYPEAAASFAAEPNEERRLAGTAILARRQGRGAEAQAAFDKMVALYGEKSHYEYARVLAQWGEADRAIAELQAARRLADSGLVQMRVDPLLAPLRSRPEFAELLKSVGFV